MAENAAEAREERVEKMEGAEPEHEPEVSEAEPEVSEAEPEAAATPAGVPQGSIGIEIGAEKCVCAASCVRRAATAVLVRNEVSNESTPTIVGFKDKECFVGEDALAQQGRNVANSVTGLANLLAATVAPVGASFTVDADGTIPVQYSLGDDAGPMSAAPELLLALLLKKLGQASAVSQTIQDSFGAEVSATGYTLTLAIPSFFTAVQKARVKDAAAIAGLPAATVVPAHCAIAAQYTCRHAKELVALKPAKDDFAGDKQTVLFVDVGSCQLTATICEFTVESVVGGMVIKTRPKGKVRAVASELGLGGEAIDAAIFAHLAADTQERYSETVTMGTRVGLRLQRACEKAKKVLSSVTETPIMVENLVPDQDIKFTLTRSTLEGLCTDIAERTTALVGRVLTEAGVSGEGALTAVEIVGGGTRTPFVQQAILAALANAGLASITTLNTTLDSSSACATGAACYGAGLSGIEITDVAAEEEEAAGCDEEQIVALTAKLGEINAQTAAQVALAAARSNFEACIYDWRNRMDSDKNKALLKRDELEPLLTSAEDWLYTDEGYDATAEIFASKFTELSEKIAVIAEAYNAKVVEDEAKLNAELAVGEAERMAEEAISGDSSVDTKLPYKQRMHKVEINKKEGNELVKDGNFGEGIKRYNNALMHCSKFYDLSPEQMETLKAAKLSLYSNIAMCANKQSDWKMGIENCTKALEIDPKNLKALFRRATAYEKTNKWDEAKADLDTGLAEAPEDKNFAKMLVKVKKKKAAQADKDKKMYGKMFG